MEFGRCGSSLRMDVETTVEFYRRLGFEVALQTVNEEANGEELHSSS